MKKISFLTCISVGLVVFLLFLSNYVKGMIVETAVVKVESALSKDILVCPGRIEYGETTGVFHTTKAVIGKLDVKPGDKVKKGDRLTLVGGIADGGSDPSINHGDMPINGGESQIPNGFEGIYQPDKDDKTISSSSFNVTDGTSVEIKSPCDGIITSVNAKVGSVVSPGVPILCIADVNSLRVRMSVGESIASSVIRGQKVRITGSGFKGSEYTGEVEDISCEARQVTSQSGTDTVVDVLVKMGDCGPEVKPGFSAKCEILREDGEKIPVVPYGSIISGDEGKEYVYVYKDGFAYKTDVKTGRNFECGTGVISGVSKGDLIVSDVSGMSGNKVRVRVML